MPKKQAFIDKSGVKFVENFQKNQKIKKFPSRTEIRYLTAFMQKSQFEEELLQSVREMKKRKFASSTKVNVTEVTKARINAGLLYDPHF